jgi:hypothetical protein
VNDERRGPDGKLVLPLLLAVFRLGIDDRLVETRARQLQPRQPVILDLGLAREVVGEEVAGDAHLLVGTEKWWRRKPTKNTSSSGSAFTSFKLFLLFVPSAQYNMQPAAYEPSRSRASRLPLAW